ncbi:MAG: hypothetical protein IH831_09705, partial [Planctomycetes bacterium]|nr:hypothetical protein [Planctomycetota bacterium]
MLSRLRPNHVRSQLSLYSAAAMICGLLLLFSQVVYGQDAGTGQPVDDTQGAGLTSGVAVDADGVLRRFTTNDPTGQLARQRAQEALAQLDGDIARPSKLRKVSLTRLARLIRQAIDEGHGP